MVAEEEADIEELERSGISREELHDRQQVWRREINECILDFDAASPEYADCTYRAYLKRNRAWLPPEWLQ